MSEGEVKVKIAGHSEEQFKGKAHEGRWVHDKKWDRPCLPAINTRRSREGEKVNNSYSKCHDRVQRVIP